MEIEITHAWDGSPIAEGERVGLRLLLDGAALCIEVEAPFHADPPPPGPPGPTPLLWEYEAVELFLLAPRERYLEIELGPHGHHLALELRGRRNVVRHGMPIGWRARIRGDRWSGTARVPLDLLPAAPALRANAYALHGQGPERRYLAWLPGGDAAPDFHRLDLFAPIQL